MVDKRTVDHTTPINEQETVIYYDKAINEWELYTTNPVHARKWQDYLTDDRKEVYNAKTGQLIEIEGRINGNVSIRKSPNLSPEQRQAIGERLHQHKHLD